MAYLEGQWGYPETEGDSTVFFGQPAHCSRCDHNIFQIVLITDLFGKQPVGLCDQCGTLHPILPVEAE